MKLRRLKRLHVVIDHALNLAAASEAFKDAKSPISFRSLQSFRTTYISYDFLHVNLM